MQKARNKLIAILIIAAVLTVLYFIDVVVASSYSVDVLSVTPKDAPADGHSPVSITLQVKNSGKSVVNHIIYALAENGGSFKSVRLKTDSQGKVTFTYYPYLKTSLNTLSDVNLRFSDESNSIFISVPAKKDVKVHLVEPVDSGDSNLTNDNLF